MFQKNNFLINIKIKNKILNIYNLYFINFLLIKYKKFFIYHFLLIKNNKIYNFVKFFIIFTFTKSNIFFSILNSLGYNLFFYSINFLFKKKFKNVKILQIIKTILTKLKQLIKYQISIHIYNNKNFLKNFITKISKKLKIINIKFFKKIPFNGCRQKK